MHTYPQSPWHKTLLVRANHFLVIPSTARLCCGLASQLNQQGHTIPPNTYYDLFPSSLAARDEAYTTEHSFNTVPLYRIYLPVSHPVFVSLFLQIRASGHTLHLDSSGLPFIYFAVQAGNLACRRPLLPLWVFVQGSQNLRSSPLPSFWVSELVALAAGWGRPRSRAIFRAWKDLIQVSMGLHRA